MFDQWSSPQFSKVKMINPSDSQMQAFLATDQSEPVMFVNLHRYHETARYPDDYEDANLPAGVSGREAYHRYLSKIAAEYVPRVGGRVWLAGPVDMTFIGTGDWDEIVVGRYPSKADAMRVPTLPGYEALAVHREAGLACAQTLVLGPDRLVIDAAPSLPENE